jgi:hypothetical protein
MGTFDSLVYVVLYWAAQALTVWALVDSLIRPAVSFPAAGKLTKPAWAAITAVAALAIWWLGPMSFLGLPAIVAAVVYLVDVRPAVRGLRRGNSW